MGTELERLSSLSSGQQLDYLVSAPALPLGEPFRPLGDELGLVTHGRISEAVTLGVFSRLDNVAAAIIKNDPQVRHEFVGGGGSVKIAEFTLGATHKFCLSRIVADHSLHYEVERRDQGSEDGGFRFIRREDGAVLFKLRQLETYDEESPKYAQALGQASRFIDILHTRFSVPVLPRDAFVEDMFTNNDFFEQVKKLDRHERAALRRAWRFISSVGRTAAQKLYTEPAPTKIEPFARRLSVKRIAVLAALAPIPGYSAALLQPLPVPRPASIEVAVDAATSISHTFHAKQKKIEAYDNAHLDLPSIAQVSTDGKAHQLAVTPNVSDDIELQAPFVHIRQGDNMPALEGKSPRIIGIESGLLMGKQCFTIPVRPDAKTYGFSAATGADADGLTIQASGNVIKLCNTSDLATEINGRTFFFDGELS